MISTNGSDSSIVAPAAVTPKLPVTMDTKGRVRTSKEQRRAILADFERSGVSVTQFARRTGLKSTFAAWVQRYRRPKRPALKSPMRLLEAVVTPTPLPGPFLQVHLPGGARLELREASQVPLVAALVRALEKPC